MRPIVLVLSATALIVASSQPIRADPIRVDQVSSLSASPGSAVSSPASATSPSMVVGISGQLIALEVFLSRWANGGTAEDRVAHGAASFGDATSLLASHTITPFAIPTGLARAPVHFDLAAAQLQVVAGRLLAFIEGNPAAFGVPLPGSGVPPVSSGPGSRGPGGPGLGDPPQADPTPEPTTIALVGSGLLLGAMGRRRQRQRKQSREQ